MNIIKSWSQQETTLDKHIISVFTYKDELGYDTADIRVDALLDAFAELVNTLVDKGVIGETAVKGIIGDPYGFEFKE